MKRRDGGLLRHRLANDASGATVCGRVRRMDDLVILVAITVPEAACARCVRPVCDEV